MPGELPMQLLALCSDRFQGFLLGLMAPEVVTDLVHLNTRHPALAGLVKANAFVRARLIHHVLAMGGLPQVADAVVKAVPVAVVDPPRRVSPVIQLPSNAVLKKRSLRVERNRSVSRGFVASAVTCLYSVPVAYFPGQHASFGAIVQLLLQKLQWREGF